MVRVSQTDCEEGNDTLRAREDSDWVNVDDTVGLSDFDEVLLVLQLQRGTDKKFIVVLLPDIPIDAPLVEGRVQVLVGLHEEVVSMQIPCWSGVAVGVHLWSVFPL